MSSGIDIQFVRENYAKMSDDELTRIAMHDASGLTIEAQQVIKEEILKRGLHANLVKEVDAQNKSYTVEDVNNFCELIQNLPCPITGSTSEKLSATLTAEAVSYLVVTRYKKKIVVGTSETLKKANNTALLNSVLMGWWGFPWGIIRTIQAIVVNLKNKRTNFHDTPNDFLKSFVVSNIRTIDKYQNNQHMLLQLISAK